MRYVVVEFAVCGERAGVEFVDGIADAIALVRRAVSVASVGGLSHPYADVAYRDHPRNKFQRDRSALTFGDVAQRESLPGAFGSAVVKRLELAGPELDSIFFRIRPGPGDADRVEVSLGAEVDQ